MTENHEVVGHDEWTETRQALLVEEKEFTRGRDELSRRRRELQWEAVDKEYTFEGPNGKETLVDLFDGRSQVIVYHFMFDPEWDEGCPSCSFWADNFDPNVVHLNARGVTLVAVSRAPFAKIAPYKERMGWSGFHWVSSFNSDFNYDYGVSFTPEQQATKAIYNYRVEGSPPPDREGISVFFRDGIGKVFHTYSTYARGLDMMNAAYHYLDLVPLGRDEEGRSPQYWLRRHDEYSGEVVIGHPRRGFEPLQLQDPVLGVVQDGSKFVSVELLHQLLLLPSPRPPYLSRCSYDEQAGRDSTGGPTLGSTGRGSSAPIRE